MGSEAGQDLDTIIRRKEMERTTGRGIFAWGIGNSIGPAVEYARTAIGDANLQVLFTAMRSAPKSIDVAPSSIAVWLSYQTKRGDVLPLPDHVLVTSRAHQGEGFEKQNHYALICSADVPLDAQHESMAVCPDGVRNLVSFNPVGASQVTAVVRRVEGHVDERAYPVLFRAKLAEQCFVKLASRVVLSGDLLSIYNEACAAKDPDTWRKVVVALKNLARSRPSPSRQADLF